MEAEMLCYFLLLWHAYHQFLKQCIDVWREMVIRNFPKLRVFQVADKNLITCSLNVTNRSPTFHRQVRSYHHCGCNGAGELSWLVKHMAVMNNKYSDSEESKDFLDITKNIKCLTLSTHHFIFSFYLQIFITF